MTQATLPLRHYGGLPQELPEKAEVVGLRCEDETITLRFMARQSTAWGQAARQIIIDRKLAEELSRLLAIELEDYPT